MGSNTAADKIEKDNIVAQITKQDVKLTIFNLITIAFFSFQMYTMIFALKGLLEKLPETAHKR
jgi:hypothetical protein